MIEKTTPRDGQSRAFDWTDYHRYDEIMAFIDEVAANNSFAEIFNIGQSYEGREMNGVRFTKAGTGMPNVWVEAGIFEFYISGF